MIFQDSIWETAEQTKNVKLTEDRTWNLKGKNIHEFVKKKNPPEKIGQNTGVEG